MQELTPVPHHIINLADHEAEAQRRLEPDAWTYLNGAAADGQTHHTNAKAWQSIQLLPRVLRNLAESHTRVTVLGTTWPHPILLAPSAYQCLAHSDGELATALAAAAQHTGMVLSTQSSTPLEDVARLYRSQRESASPLWLQLYLQPQREHTLQLIARAEAAGYEALVLTVDAPLHGVRDAERRSRFRLPPHIGAVNLKGLQAMSPSETSSSLHTLLAHAPTWADVSWLVQQTRLPVLLKGILHPDDARLALDHGAQGVIVSNHGGRTLDTTCATAHALPGIAHAVGHQMSILVDGGIRRGTDVVKALCLGAHSVLIGRPVLHGLAHSGAMGVGHVIRLLLDEFQVAMALCGAASVADCSPELLVPGRIV